MKMEKILVVDDDEGQRNAIQFLLKKQNYLVIAANNGISGLRVLNEYDDIHVLIVDLAMPELSGVELLEAIKDRKQPLRRIVLTAHDIELTHTDADKLNVFSYLNKPISKNTLLFAVKSAFKDIYRDRKGGKAVDYQKNVEDVRIKQLLTGIETDKEETKYQWDVFISYSTSDRPLVEEIASDLKSNEITYWLDLEQIKPGDHIMQTIVKGLQGSRFVLCCFSHNQLKSGWSRVEYETILNEGITNTTGQKVLPLILDDLKHDDVPLLIRSYKCERYSDPIGYQNILKRLKEPLASG